MAQIPDVPPALTTFLVDRAEGNPFYLEELIKILIEDQVILTGGPEPQDQAAPWRVMLDRLSNVRLPPTLAGVLQTRLQSLPALERLVLQSAAVYGRVFWTDSVQHLLGAAFPQASVENNASSSEILLNLPTVLETLARKELIIRRGASAFAGTEEYTFRQALFQEVIYEHLDPTQRQAWHAQAAQWLTQQSGERASEYAGAIGHHFECADQTAAAAHWYGQAGRHAMDTGVPVAAIDHYQKALAFLPQHPDTLARRVQLYEDLAELLNWQARYPDVIATYQGMDAAAVARDDLVAQARAWNGIALAQHDQGDYHSSLESSQRAEELARQAGEAGLGELASALSLKGVSWFRLGDMEATLAFETQALAVSSQVGHRKVMARSHSVLGWAHSILGNNAQSDDHMAQSLAIYREIGDRKGVGSVVNNLGVTAHIRGDYQAAYAFYTEAFTIAEEMSDLDNELVIISNMGGALVGLGEYPRAEEKLRDFLTMPGANNWFGVAETYIYLAEACLGQQKIPEALAAAHHGLTLAQAADHPDFIGAGWRVLGMIAAHMPLSAAEESPAPPPPPADQVAALPPRLVAQECFAESIRIFTEIESHGEQARTLRAWAHYELNHGDPAKGAALWDEARGLFMQLGMSAELARTPPLPSSRSNAI